MIKFHNTHVETEGGKPFSDLLVSVLGPTCNDLNLSVLESQNIQLFITTAITGGLS